jgi:hypothetical protein
MPDQHLFQYVHQLVLKLLTVKDLDFPVLFTFHPFAVNFILVYNKI